MAAGSRLGKWRDEGTGVKEQEVGNVKHSWEDTNQLLPVLPAVSTPHLW